MHVSHDLKQTVINTAAQLSLILRIKLQKLNLYILTEHYVRVFAMTYTSVVCNVRTHCALLTGLKLSAIFLRHFVP